jgi:tRNA C32,U32 (ribose-2'-O)-methylase TrmJ
MSREELAKRIETAKKAILAAQENLGVAIRDIQVARRSEKQHASEALQEALARLHLAHGELVVLDQLLTPETDQ